MKLTDCVEYLSRGKSPNYVDRSEISIINQACIYWNGINSSKVKYQNPNSTYEKAVVQNRDVLINSTGTGTLGRAAVYYDSGELTIADSHVTIIRTDKNKLLPEFLCLYLRRDTTQKELYAKCVSGSTNQIELSKEKLLSFSVPEIPVEQQHAIVINLGKLSHIIEIRNEELSALDGLIKARFVEMFGDPISNEKRWPTDSLTHACSKIYGGGTPSKSHPEHFEGSIPWVSPKDMKSDVIIDSIDHITEDAIEHSTTNLVPEGSVLMVIRSGILKHDLPVAINAVPVTINQDMKAFVPGESITASFLRNYFKAIEPDVLAGVRGVTADNIDFKAFQQKEIIIPPINKQNEFEEFCKQIDKSKFAIQKSLDETQLLFDSLMQEYFG